MKRNPHCRIGRVSYKPPFAGAIGVEEPAPDLTVDLRAHAREIGDAMPDMVGFVIVAWDADGFWNRASAMTADSPLLATMVPSFVADVIRRDIVKEMINRHADGLDHEDIR